MNESSISLTAMSKLRAILRSSRFRHCGLACALAVLAISCSPGPTAARPPTSQQAAQSAAEIEPVTTALMKRLESGAAQPAPDARAAADRGDFGFIYSGAGLGGGEHMPGVFCHTPYLRGGSAKASIHWGDSFDAELSRRMSLYERYAAEYNRALIDHPRFPYADLCAPVARRPAVLGEPGGLSHIGRPARALTRAPLNLHEAARRGSPAQVRRFLREGNVEDLDHFNMTALAWAVAHGREDVAGLLLSAGAKSMPAGADSMSVTPVLAAISQKRMKLLRRLDLPKPLPGSYVEAAIRTNDVDMVRKAFDAPHEALRSGSLLGGIAPSAEVAALLIQRQGKAAANAALLEGAQRGRIDLMRVAIDNGADVNTSDYRGETPLMAALELFDPDPLPLVDLLLSAGARVNDKPGPGAGWETAYWRAYRRATSSAGPRLDIFRRVSAAGGDASVPMRPGVPSVWTVVFPPRGDLTEIIAPAPEVLEMLVAAGMDLNAPYQDQCVLGAVETLTGQQGDVAKTLRRLGAKRRSASGRCTL
jgi:hypothetical protein